MKNKFRKGNFVIIKKSSRYYGQIQKNGGIYGKVNYVNAEDGTNFNYEVDFIGKNGEYCGCNAYSVNDLEFKNISIEQLNKASN